VQATTTRPMIMATADGAGVVSHAGSRLLADVADRTTLTGQLAEELAGLRKPRARHDPGRVLVDMAVAVADGATTISDVAVLADQAALFGSVASDSTCWRLLDRLDAAQLGAVARARAATREVVWAQRAELTGEPFPPATAAGQVLPGLVVDLDASIVVYHSEKELAAPTFKRTFGYHPMLAFCDNTGEFLAARLRRGNAGSNTAADHISVLDAALAQLPDTHRHSTPILVRADTAGCTREFLAHIRGRRDDAVSCEFSVGWAITDKERTAIGVVPARVWVDAIDADGGHRDGAALAEITGVLPARSLTGYPAGTRVIVRRERPHPGAQLDAFEERDGWRYTAFATDTAFGQLARLDARHRAHARVEDRIRCAKDTGLDHVLDQLGDRSGVWIVDDTGFIKKGVRSAGVQRQYTGTSGKIDNCQLGVFLAYGSSRGRALVDRELYLPASWTEDAARCAAAGVPTGVEFATKPQLALDMLARAHGAGVLQGWVTADEAFGQNRAFRTWLAARAVPFVLATRSDDLLSCPTVTGTRPTTSPSWPGPGRGSDARPGPARTGIGSTTGPCSRCTPPRRPTGSPPGGATGCWSAARSTRNRARTPSWRSTAAPALFRRRWPS